MIARWKDGWMEMHAVKSDKKVKLGPHQNVDYFSIKAWTMDYFLLCTVHKPLSV